MAGRFNGNSEYKHELERVRDVYLESTRKSISNNEEVNYSIKLKKLQQKAGKRFEAFKKSYNASFTQDGEYIPYKTRIVETLSDDDKVIVLLDNEGLEYANIPDAPIIGTKKVLKRKHGAIKEIINNLDDELKNSVLVMDGYGSNKGKKNVLVSSLSKYGNPVLIGLKYQNSQVTEIKINSIDTIHQRDSLKYTLLNHLENDCNFYISSQFEEWIKQFEDIDNTLINEIKKRSESVQWESSPQTNSLSDFNISQSGNLSIDSKGNSLSNQQQEYFKESKVLDKAGNLKVMYRGGNEDINVFDRKKSRASNLYGRGFYFTDSEAHAKQYGEAREYYLNITNPLWNEKNITREQIVKLLQAIEDDGEDMDLSNYGYGAAVESIADSLMEKDDYGKLFDISTTAVGDLVKTTELFNELNGTTYDGFILPTETVVFNSNQIKNVDNVNPTENKDIRYSISSKYTNDVKDIMKKVWFITNA
ncbi:MAG: hypothetical protein PUF50_02370 [Erysipelotrichaceae bacterium]|nr:hypothetical protein [Erysipelotrichaceae bacterium]